MTPRVIVMVLVMVQVFAVGGALATDKQPTRDELQARFQERHPHIMKLKDEAKVGETWQGFIDVVSGKGVNANERKLLDEENADRTTLYRIIADETGPQVSPATVGLRNGKRNFSNANPSHYLLPESGRWVQKRDHK